MKHGKALCHEQLLTNDCGEGLKNLGAGAVGASTATGPWAPSGS